jgi:hypothetical protein
MKLLEKIRTVVAKPIMEAILTEILDEAVKQSKITQEQKDLIIKVGAEIGKIKIKN